jgi:adenine-specific DNA-methyltransferase
MARLDDLVAQIDDQSLRRNIEAALADMKRRQRFGLVFEEHIPETTSLFGLPVQDGALVQRRDDPSAKTLYRVIETTPQGYATIKSTGDGETEMVPISELLVVKQFGEPMYPALTPLGSVRRGAVDKPHHAVINGENFHALQLLIYQFEGQVDCIYIDPPYNTGARDWKYNNRYVDDSDAWRHSKWLSMMEKRLRLAKRLLKPDGVLIVTIDEHEVHHLGMLLEQLFREYQRYMVTIVNAPQGNDKANFSRVEEYAFFCVPPSEQELIQGSPIDFVPEAGELDLDLDEEDYEEPEPEGDHYLASDVEANGYVSENARRRGNQSLRRDRPHMFFPIYIDEQERRVVRAGPPIPLDAEPDFGEGDGLRPIWPIDSNGYHRRWRWGYDRMVKLIEAGEIRLGQYNKKRDTWAINRVQPKKAELKKLKTVWRHTSHNAGTHGSGLLAQLLGQGQTFSFPKSVYATRDCLAAVCRSRPNALIVDFFAGSGTTLHATLLMNEADGGRRRCILVTNNEVEERVARQLRKEGVLPADPEWEKHGVFEQVARPRCEAVVTGRRPDGIPIPGRYLNGRLFEEGFEENVEFYRLDYLDPDEVDLGFQFEAILPALWLAAGGIGDREKPEDGRGFSMPESSTYGVLFRESRFRHFGEALERRPEVTHVWLVTDSEEAYAEMRSALPTRLSVSMLYRDYLRNFRINTERNL